MDITFVSDGDKFNFRVAVVFIYENKLLTVRNDNSPYRVLPGGRVKTGEAAESAIVRETEEELGITPRIVRPLWLDQAFFTEDTARLNYHELCIYFLADASDTELPKRGERFTLREGRHTHDFEWIAFERLRDEYFYPVFLKESIYELPKHFTIRTDDERT